MILPLVAWAVVTGGHFVLMAAASRALAPEDASLDERVFVSVLGGIASLSIVLHVAAATVGISLISGIVGLAAWHAALWWMLARRARVPAPAVSGSGRVGPLDLLALAVYGGIVLTWCAVAPASANVNGPDAAHYHVPVAVNLGMGVNLFDLPATPHLYPMAGSVITAWFIVPFGNPIVADLAMALPCVLLVASLNMLFRCATGLSGAAWASWISLALFSTPMFRAVSEGAADLWITAAFAASVAVILHAWVQGRWNTVSVGLAGGAIGLLVGSKTTGVVAAGLIVAAAALVAALRRAFGGPRVQLMRPLGLAMAIGLAACLGAGGVWLVRNWVQFGSPLAPSGVTLGGMTLFDGEPFQRGKYLSVLAEMDTDAFHLWPRTQAFAAQWFGTWFMAALWPIAALVIDVARRGPGWKADYRWWSRVTLLLVVCGVGAVLIWLLIGAPWTGLERSRGMTLRYVLPIAAPLALLSFLGAFPRAFPWYERPKVRLCVAGVLVAGSSTLFWLSLHPFEGIERGVPDLQWPWFVAAAAAVILARVWRDKPLLWRQIGVAIGLAALIAWWAPVAAAHDKRLRAERQAALDEAVAALAAGIKPPDAWREPFLALHAAEMAEGRRCSRQRFFALMRFDEPLALQPPQFGNEVFYAGRDVGAARRAGPIGACDYVITTPALVQTDKGQALAAALAGQAELRPIARTSDVIILATAVR